MIITKEWLEKRNCRGDFVNWFLEQTEIDGEKLVKKLVDENKLEWASSLLVRLLNHPQQVAYAVFAAELVLDIFEQKYPSDKRPRQAIEAAKNWLEYPSKKNKYVAGVAAVAAGNAGLAAWATAKAAGDAVGAAWAAAKAAAWASEAAGSARVAKALWATWAVETAARAKWQFKCPADVAMLNKEIIKYGLTLLTKKNQKGGKIG